MMLMTIMSSSRVKPRARSEANSGILREMRCARAISELLAFSPISMAIRG